MNVRTNTIVLFILLILPSIVFAHPHECGYVVEAGVKSGFLTLGNILKITGTIVAFVGAVFLWGLLDIPIFFAKLLLFLGGIITFVFGHSEWAGIPAGVYGFASALFFAVFVIWVFIEHISDGELIRFVSLILFVIWSAIAINYEASVVAFGAVLALAFIISSFEASSLLSGSLGIRDEDYSNGAVFAGIGILLFYLAIKKLSFVWYPSEIFETSALYIGGLAAATGLIFNSSKFCKSGTSEYWFNQVLSICFAFSAIFIGSYANSTDLEKIGGTFIFLYIIEKVVDLIYLIGDFILGVIIIILLGVGLVYLGTYMYNNADFYGQYIYFLK